MTLRFKSDDGTIITLPDKFEYTDEPIRKIAREEASKVMARWIVFIAICCAEIGLVCGIIYRMWR